MYRIFKTLPKVASYPPDQKSTIRNGVHRVVFELLTLKA